MLSQSLLLLFAVEDTLCLTLSNCFHVFGHLLHHSFDLFYLSLGHLKLFFILSLVSLVNEVFHLPCKCKSCAVINLRVTGELAFELRHYSLAEVKAETNSCLVLGTGTLKFPKELEQLYLLVLAYSDSSIADMCGDNFIIPVKAYSDLDASLHCELESVG
jgi:hypothetical protein